MQGSIRQLSAGSWELRVLVGTDPETGRRIDRTATSRGTREQAERELAEMAASVRSTRMVGVRSPMSELFEAWFAIAETGWAPTTIRQTRSVLDCYLHPHLGRVAVGDVTPAAIDKLYVRLRRSGGVGGRPLMPGTLARVHVVLRSSLSQAMRWGWIWDNQPSAPIGSRRSPKRSVRQPRSSYAPCSPTSLNEIHSCIPCC
jgi:integrase